MVIITGQCSGASEGIECAFWISSAILLESMTLEKEELVGLKSDVIN